MMTEYHDPLSNEQFTITVIHEFRTTSSETERLVTPAM